MLRPAPKTALRTAGSVLLRIAGAVVAFAVIITAGTWAVHGVILLLRAIP